MNILNPTDFVGKEISLDQECILYFTSAKEKKTEEMIVP